MPKRYEIDDHSDDLKQALEKATLPILEAIGITAERHAKFKCPVGTPESTGIRGYIGGTLRNSITHAVDMSEQVVYVGTNVEYGKYVEMGTKKMKAQPFLRPAATDHSEEYKRIAEAILKNS